MDNELKENYLEWFKKAGEDELSISAILNGGGAPSTACFLAQQMVEKYLKGLLVFHNSSFPKTHDLVELETLLVGFNPGLKEYESELDLLGNYYVETRYPGDYPELTYAEAKQAFEAAQSKIQKIADASPLFTGRYHSPRGPRVLPVGEWSSRAGFRPTGKPSGLTVSERDHELCP